MLQTRNPWGMSIHIPALILLQIIFIVLFGLFTRYVTTHLSIVSPKPINCWKRHNLVGNVHATRRRLHLSRDWWTISTTTGFFWLAIRSSLVAVGAILGFHRKVSFYFQLNPLSNFSRTQVGGFQIVLIQPTGCLKQLFTLQLWQNVVKILNLSDILLLNLASFPSSHVPTRRSSGCFQFN